MSFCAGLVSHELSLLLATKSSRSKRRHARGRDQPRHRRGRIDLPVAGAARAVQQHQAGAFKQPLGQRRWGTALECLGRDVGRGRHVDEQRAAVAVRGDGVDPRNAQVADRPVDAGHIPGLRDVQPGVDHARVAAVGIAQRIGFLRGPRHAGGGHRHHRAVFGVVKGVCAALDAAVGQLHVEGDRARGHLVRRAVDQIGGGVALGQPELEQREAAAGGDRVGPRHVAVEADADDGEGGDRRAHHVELAGHGQVDFVEAVGGRPREVRVAEQHAAPVLRGGTAEGPAVAADGQVAQPQLAVERGDIDGVRRDHRMGHGRPARRLRIDDAGQHRAGAGLDRLLLAHAHHVGQRERAHPGGVAARGGEVGRRGVLQVAVVAGDVAAQQFARLGRHPRIAVTQRGRIDDALEERIRASVGDGLERHGGGAVRPERLRALAVDGDDLVGEQAEIVLRIGIGHAEAEAGVVVGADVRNAEAGAADLGR